MDKDANRSPFQRLARWFHAGGLLLGAGLVFLSFRSHTPLMPGQLSQAHAAFEDRCEACHPTGGTKQETACRACHPTIGSTSPAAIHVNVASRCATCHVEHRSREYPLRLDDPARFDHYQTRFAFTERHASMACAACHPPGLPYYEQRKPCRECHGQWDQTNFDHRRTVGIALRTHRNLACEDCHPGRSYDAPPACPTCHPAGAAHQPGQDL